MFRRAKNQVFSRHNQTCASVTHAKIEISHYIGAQPAVALLKLKSVWGV